MHYQNLCELIQHRGNTHAAGVTFINGTDQETYLSYAGLYKASLQVLGSLQAAGLKKGDELVFQVNDDQTFIITFWACILGGILPVPLATDNSHDHRMKLFNIWPVLHTPRLLISAADAGKLEAFAGANNVIGGVYAQISTRIIDPGQLFNGTIQGQAEPATADDIAFIQFSSGSTGAPKGVVLTHGNLLSNVGAIEIASGYTAADSLLSWMPLTHDMGLIGFHISPVFSGVNHFIIPTPVFIRRPAIWLDVASKHRVTVLSSPNFGYEYILKNLKQGSYDWDLASVRIIYNGAEPISAAICSRFISAFKQYGLSPNSICPVYGLAENSLAVSISKIDDEVLSLKLSRTRLAVGHRISIIPAENEGAVFVNLGRAVPYCDIRIADDAGNSLPPECIGYVLIKGRSATSGYYNNKAATESAINKEGWLNTGDIGFIKDDCVYLTGRSKDVLFCNGQNFYAHDIEALAQDLAGVELNKIAVGGSFNPQMEREEIIAFVVFKGKPAAFADTVKTIKSYVAKKTGVGLTHVLPVKNIPRTTSGKIQRYKLMEQYQNGEFDDMITQLDAVSRESEINLIQYTSSLSETEQQILTIWQQLLKGRVVDAKNDFFENGGNSLKAVALQLQILKQWSVDIDVALLYQNSTLAGIAQLISNGAYKPYVPYSPVTPEAPEQVYALSAFQKGLYYHWVLNPVSLAYNIPVALLIEGDVDHLAITNALKVLVERYDSLRIRFVPGAAPGFTVKKYVDVNVGEVDLQVADWFTGIRQYIKPFNLHSDTLFRFTLFKIGAGKYLFLSDFHHVIADGVSVNNFVHELINIIKGEPVAGLPVQYRDYIALESEKSKTGSPAAESYWSEKLSGDWPVLNLPLDKPRPAHFDYSGERLFFRLDDLKRRQLADLAKQQNCSLHALLFTLYKILLYKYTGQPDIVIGIPVAVRNHPDLLDVFGMMVNNLAIRQPVNSAVSVADTLKSEAGNLSKALIYKEFPFDEQVKLAGGVRDTSRNQLFDTMFVFQNMVDDLPGTDNLSFKACAFDPGIAKYDLSLEIFDDGALLQGCFEFCSSLFNRDTIANMSDHFINIINQALMYPNQIVGRLSVLGNDELTLLARYNATQAAYPHNQTVQQLFEDQVFKNPDSIALIFNDEQLTYAALYARVKVLAMELDAAGLGPGAVAGILLRRSPDTIVAILAVLLTGATYMPLDTELPAGRIRFILDDSRCGLLVTNAASAAVLTADSRLADFNTFYLDGDNRNARKNPSAMAKHPGLINAAYIIYTSGTTGNPKGVVIEQRSFINYVTWAAKVYFKPGPQVFALFTSISFDLTITSIFTPLLTGNTIIIYDDTEHETLIETLINDNRATIAKLTPSHLRMIGSLYSNSAALHSNIKTFIVGGEQLPGSLAGDIYELFDHDIDIYNEYGPTEATVGCMIHRYDRHESGEAVPIGVPADNVRLYLLDDDLAMVPVGVPGELYIAGDCLAQGYLFNPEATAARFVPDPFFEGAKMYRSGDRGRLLPNGKMEYLGRLDSQVKINGYRIELAEIEQVMKQHPLVSEAIADVDKKGMHPIIRAYYISAAGVDSNELKTFLTSMLPYYMLPASLTRIDDIPLTPNHKIDMAALGALILPAPAATVAAVKDETAIRIIDIWKEVLNQPDLSPGANFFQLGGDSIKAFQISSRLLDLGINITARDILIWQTIDQLIIRIKADDRYAGSLQGPLTGDLELPPAASWFMARNFKYPGHYNQTLLFNLHRQPDIDLFEQAFDLIIQNNDGLRLNYDVAKHKLFYNQAHIENKFSITVIGAEHLQSPADILRQLEENTQHEFCIQTDLLLRAAIFKLSNDEHILAISAHHLVIDGVSWRILLEELYQVYIALERGAAPPVQSRSDSLNDWQTARRKRRSSAAYKASLEGWTGNEDQQVSLLIDMPVKIQINSDTFKMKWVLNTVDMPYLLKEASLNFSFDTGLLLFGSFLQMMQQWTCNNHFFITNEYHGRDFEGFNFSKTIGWFTAIYPSLWKWEGDGLIEKLNYLKKQVSINSSKAVDYGIWRYSNSKAGLTDMETADVQFNFLGEFGAELSNELFSYSNKSPLLQSHPDNPMTAKIEANIMVINEKLHVEIIADSKTYLPATICEIMDLWASALQQMIADLKDCTIDPKTIQLSNSGLSQNEINDLFN